MFYFIHLINLRKSVPIVQSIIQGTGAIFGIIH